MLHPSADVKALDTEWAGTPGTSPTPVSRAMPSPGSDVGRTSPAAVRPCECARKPSRIGATNASASSRRTTSA